MLILIAICGFGVAGVLGSITARDWTEDFLDPLEQIIPNADARNAVSSDLVDIRNDLAATAVSNHHKNTDITNNIIDTQTLKQLHPEIILQGGGCDRIGYFNSYTAGVHTGVAGFSIAGWSPVYDVVLCK